ncbi:YkvA family protein [Ralstonia solanacearum]|uniref:DUF1232 domain-containing protein n=1 Tax=Ralstonia solanacearum TaxID=305 RepID=A0AAE3T605_RALSL|nr:YkvA family protein [Ralstonia solanacearum]MBB6581600.1 DUF1232 domain-containing protein [Ralstonia solanacearum]MDB0524726.1 DUF1232 domain-containing protein [Ralstonia solanacearum]
MFVRLFRLWSVVRNDVRLLWFALRHPEAPWWLMPAALLLVGYVVSPIDLIPDVIPVIGWVDDIVLVPLALHALLRALPERVREDARSAAARRVRPSGR